MYLERGHYALGSTVLVSDLGIDTANAGSSTTGGLYVSQDGGGSWKQVSTESVGRLLVVSYRGGPLFVAEHPWVTKGAATGPSQIFTSPDGLTWLRAGEVPGPAVFGMLDVPLVSFGKNIPGDGIYRLIDGDRAPHLEPIPGSPQTQGILQGPRGELWFFEPGNVVNPRLSTDGGRTTRVAAAGLAGRIAGLFVANGKVYAVGDGAYEWDGAQWRVANILTGKASAVFQTTERVFIQDLSGGFWRSR